MASFVSCQNDDVTNTSSVDAMVSETGDLLNQSYPFKKIRVEGEGLAGLKTITLDNKIDVSFNPTYNSDKSFIFTIPFDDKLGSRFGHQPITFVTATGTVTKDIEILQPVPTINSTIPAVATPGYPLAIEGTWFYNVSSVTVAGKDVNYTLASSTSIIIALPADTASGAEVVIVTPGGMASKVLAFATVVLVSDFDGGGARTDYGSWGDVGAFNPNTTGGPTGNYASYSWLGSTKNGYNGCGGGGGKNFLSDSNNNASKAYLEIDLSASVEGANVAIQLNTIEGINYGYNFKITDVNWTTYTISLADFKDNYGYGGNAATNLDVSKINEIKMGIAQGDTPNPSTINFDNIKLRYQ